MARCFLPGALVAMTMLSGCSVGAGCETSPPRVALLAAGTGVSDIEDMARFALRDGQRANTVCWAAKGDKHAQYAIGYAFEYGVGTQKDVRQARRFYERAAQSDPERRAVYSAPVGGERFGTVLSVPSGSGQKGLPEAREALRRLDSVQ